MQANQCCVDVRAAWWKVDLKAHLLACCVPFFAPLGFKEHSGTWELDYVHAQASRGWRFWNSSKNTLYIITQPFILLYLLTLVKLLLLVTNHNVDSHFPYQNRNSVTTQTYHSSCYEALLFCLNSEHLFNGSPKQDKMNCGHSLNRCMDNQQHMCQGPA